LCYQFLDNNPFLIALQNFISSLNKTQHNQLINYGYIDHFYV